MATTTAAIKDSLLGSEKEQGLSYQSKANFDRHARTDDTTGESYMRLDDFVDAIAPVSENYVGCNAFRHQEQKGLTATWRSIKSNANSMLFFSTWPTERNSAELVSRIGWLSKTSWRSQMLSMR